MSDVLSLFTREVHKSARANGIRFNVGQQRRKISGKPLAKMKREFLA